MRSIELVLAQTRPQIRKRDDLSFALHDGHRKSGEIRLVEETEREALLGG